MKLSALIVCVAALLAGPCGVFGQSDTNNADANDAAFTALIGQVNADIQANKHSETDFAPELKQFDVLAARSSQQPEFAAKILLQKGVLYDEVLNDPEKTRTIFWQIKTNYASTKIAADMDEALMELDVKIHAKQVQASLPPGSPLPDFSMTNLAGHAESVALHKGKVLLLDFWATWCVPCRIELPNVLDIYAKYHDQGLDIIGVSLDDDQAQLAKGIKELKIPWPICCDGQSWKGALPNKYGITEIPATILLDQNGKILAWDLKGDDLAAAVAKALGK